MKRTVLTKIVAVVVLATATVANAAKKPKEVKPLPELRFACILNDHMVLQRDRNLTIWGHAKPGSAITVVLTEQRSEVPAKGLERPDPDAGNKKKKPAPDTGNQYGVRLAYEETNAPAFETIERKAKADAKGCWEVQIDPLVASFTPKFLVLRGDGDPVALRNILVGEVWVTAGQSNMAGGGNRSGWLTNTGLLESAVRYAKIQTSAPEELDDLPQPVGWKVCDGGEQGMVTDVSTIAYLFSKAVHRQLGVPVGVINTATGGSLGSEWTGIPELKSLTDPRVKALFSEEKAMPGRNFNGRIAPIGRLAVRGALFMQGEQQALNHRIPRYRQIFPAIISAFRRAFGQEEMPFCIISLHGQGRTDVEGGMANGYAIVGDIQYRTHLASPGTGFVTGHDISGGLHPDWKRPLGERAALWALTNLYKDPEVITARRRANRFTPRIEFEDDKARVYLLVKKSIKTKEGRKSVDAPKTVYYNQTYNFQPYLGFAIAGEDRRWYPGRVRRNLADKENNFLEVSHPLVPKPVALRYGFGNSAANLGDFYDPIPPFRTDDWPTYEREEGIDNRAIMHQMQVVAFQDEWDRVARESVHDAHAADLQLHGTPKELLGRLADRIDTSLDLLRPDEDFRTQTAEIGGDAMGKVSEQYRTPEKLFCKKSMYWEMAHRLEALPGEMDKTLRDEKLSAKLANLRKALAEFEAAVESLPDTKPLPIGIRPEPVPERRPGYSSETRAAGK